MCNIYTLGTLRITETSKTRTPQMKYSIVISSAIQIQYIKIYRFQILEYPLISHLI